MTTKLIENWRFFMKDMPSPDSYVDFGLYFMVAASLQRRVWLGDKLDALYPNPYIILAAEPGVGKGRVIKQVIPILTSFKMEIKGVKKPEDESIDGALRIKPEDIDAFNAANAGVEDMVENTLKSNKNRGERLLLPMGANATTYEKLVNNLADNRRLCSYYINNGAPQKEFKTESHASMFFCLEEASSLFRKHTEDTINFLITAWDCGDYTYDTLSRGADKIKRCCLSMLAGTTPGFMRRVFSDELLNEGFAARAIFVFEAANRFRAMFSPKFTQEQLQARKDVIEHIGKLTKITGELDYTIEARKLLENWINNIDPYTRANNSLKLKFYYARKPSHIQKLAVALHFCKDNPGMLIDADTCQATIDLLDSIEKKMHFAVGIDNKNPLADVSRDILEYIKIAGPQTKTKLLIEFFGVAKQGELEEAISFLLTSKAIDTYPEDNPIDSRKKIMKFRIMPTTKE